MRYVSIDLETTDIEPGQYCPSDPDSNRILEFAAVIEDTEKDVEIEELPHLNFYFWQKYFTGSPCALAMNWKILERIAKQKTPGYSYVRPSEVVRKVAHFLHAHGFGDRPTIVCAGKNFANFDRKFLEPLSGSGPLVQNVPPHDRSRHVFLGFQD